MDQALADELRSYGTVLFGVESCKHTAKQKKVRGLLPVGGGVMSPQ
jgi:hypothetical protein